MTIEWRALRAGEIDHELLWSAVIVTAAAAGAIVLQVAGMPALPCVFRTITGLPCLTCGAGRSLALLTLGDLPSALRLNPLVPLGAAGAVAYVVYAGGALLAGPGRLRGRMTPRESRAVRTAVALLACAVWIWLLADGR